MMDSLWNDDSNLPPPSLRGSLEITFTDIWLAWLGLWTLEALSPSHPLPFWLSSGIFPCAGTLYHSFQPCRIGPRIWWRPPFCLGFGLDFVRFVRATFVRGWGWPLTLCSLLLLLLLKLDDRGKVKLGRQLDSMDLATNMKDRQRKICK